MAKMKYIIPLICCGSPALAHHEVVVVSFLPGISIWIISTFAAFLAGKKLFAKQGK